MAIFKKGINGAFSGTIGSTVGSSWRGINYMRSLPKPSKKPATPRQLAQQAKFALAVSFLQPMKWLLNVGFNDKLRGKNTGYNRGFQLFMAQAITGDYPDFEIDFEKVALSHGSMDKLIGLTLSSDAANTLSLTWVDFSDEPTDGEEEEKSSYHDDQVYVLLYNRTEQLFTTNRKAIRQDEGLQLELPAIFAGHEFHVWVFARHREHSGQSSSQYAGTVVLAGAEEPEEETEP